MLGRNQDLPLPSGFTDEKQVSCFNDFFVSKISKIWDELNISRDLLAPVNSALIFITPDPPKMDSFSVLSDHDVAKIIHRSPSKGCEDNPIPTTLLKNILPSVLPVLTVLVNGSMQTGVFPEDLKQALVKPLLKKDNLDLVDKNYQPVSNLELVGKIIERAVTDQLTHHIAKYNLMDPKQSAHRMGHSMEMALLKVKTEILRALDNQEVTSLVLLEFSAASDMVDHQILIDRLTSMFGISGCTIPSIRSYLTCRSQRVKVGELRSDPVTLHFGVPQGSVFGPILFTLYTCPHGQIFKDHGLMYHLYADDSQLYLSFKPNTPSAQSMCLETIENCIEDIRRWMTLNMLKLNDAKTEFFILDTRQQLAKLSDVSIKIGNTTVLPVDYVCNLGFFLNRVLKNNNHINRLIAGLFNQLRNISRIQPRITYQSAKIIVQLLILSKLDYCNSLLAGTANIHLDKLQLIQNMACRVILTYTSMTMSQINSSLCTG